jgi:hypothetical protein
VNERSSKVRNLLLESTRVTGPTALFLSSGIDSNILLLALRMNDVDVTTFSFGIDGHESSDIRLASHNASVMGVKNIRIFLDPDPHGMYGDARTLIEEYGLRGKADIECMWAFYLSFPFLSLAGPFKYVFSGHSAEHPVRDSKREAIIAGKPGMADDPSWLDERRRAALVTFPNDQHRFLTLLAERDLGATKVMPFAAPAMFEAMYGASWNEVHRPRNKQVYRDAFPELEKLKTKRAQNLQLGDSRISSSWAQLVDVPGLNPHGHKTTRGIFTDIIKNR